MLAHCVKPSQEESRRAVNDRQGCEGTDCWRTASIQSPVVRGIRSREGQQVVDAAALPDLNAFALVQGPPLIESDPPATPGPSVHHLLTEEDPGSADNKQACPDPSAFPRQVGVVAVPREQI